jgi:hypothetical protein
MSLFPIQRPLDGFGAFVGESRRFFSGVETWDKLLVEIAATVEDFARLASGPANQSLVYR